MGDPNSSYVTAGIALRVSGALKPHHHHHDKVETRSVGTRYFKHAKIKEDVMSGHVARTAAMTTEFLPESLKGTTRRLDGYITLDLKRTG
jgi:hypothetical protein